MRPGRRTLELPILVDDLSPKTISDDFRGRHSIDLVRRSLESASGAFDDHSLGGPDLAVLEELESIRSMIERKSRDLRDKEVSLSRSITSWNTEVVEAQHLIETLATNLVEAGEKRIEEIFNTRAKKLKKLMDAVRKDLNAYQLACSRNPPGSIADVPPLPGTVNPDSVSDRIFNFLSHDPSSSTRQLAAVTLMLLSIRSPTVNETRYATIVLFDRAVEYVYAKFHYLMIQSLNSDFQTQDSRSKFSSVRQSILRKRLGVTSSTEERFTLEVEDKCIGDDKQVDVVGVFDDDVKDLLPPEDQLINSSMKSSHTPVIRLFTDLSLQQSICLALRRRSKNRSVKNRLVELVLFGWSTERVLIDNLKAIQMALDSETGQDANTIQKSLVILVFLLNRSVEDSWTDESCLILRELIDRVIQSSGSRGARFLSDWIQATWFALKTLITPVERMPRKMVLDSCLNLLNSAASLKGLVPWSDALLNILEKNQISSDLVGPLKSVMRRISESQ
jgi:hypothetical protein